MPGKKVIIIDEDIDVVKTLCEYLTLNHIEIIGIAHNGVDGVKLYEKTKPDIVLLDLMGMPEYDGFFVIEEIKKNGKPVKILVSTADGSEETVSRLHDMRIQVILKPWYDVELVEVINQV